MIKFTPANEAKIAAQIVAAEGRVMQRTVTIPDIRSDIESAEQKLNALEIPKKYWEGTRILSEESFRLPNSYRHIAQSTTVEIVRDKGSWKFVVATRHNCGKSDGTRLILSEEAQAHQPTAFWI